MQQSNAAGLAFSCLGLPTTSGGASLHVGCIGFRRLRLHDSSTKGRSRDFSTALTATSHLEAGPRFGGRVSQRPPSAMRFEPHGDDVTSSTDERLMSRIADNQVLRVAAF